MKKWLKNFKLIDILGITFFFLILFSSALFLLRRSSYVYVTLKIVRQDSLRNDEWYQPASWYLKNLKEGLEDRGISGKLNAKVEDVYFYPSDQSNQNIFVTLKIEATHNQRTNQYLYRGLPLLIGSYQTIEIGGVVVRGMVQNLSETKPIRNFKTYLITAKLEAEHNESFFTGADIEYHGVKNFLADNVKAGLLYLDSNGEKLVEVLNVEKTAAQKVIVSSLNNRLIGLYDPERKEVEMELALNATEVYDGSFLYREETAISLGEVIPLYFDGLSLQATIIDFEESN